MSRRVFLASSMGLLAPPALVAAPAFQEKMGGVGRTDPPQLLELRHYALRFGPMESRLSAYLRDAFIPAARRAGVGPVGVWSVSLGPDSPSLRVLLPHADAESVATLDERLEADAEYRRAGAGYRDRPASEPAWVRLESCLLKAFERVPSVMPPSGAQAGPARVFELRTYESPSEAAGRKKIEMFEQAGEIAIFRRVGLTPVFFGRRVVGSQIPGLTYMLVFADAAAREKGWAAFREDPEWLKLRSAPGFSNADILTNTHSQLLRPTDYSQL